MTYFSYHSKILGGFSLGLFSDMCPENRMRAGRSLQHGIVLARLPGDYVCSIYGVNKTLAFPESGSVDLYF